MAAASGDGSVGLGTESLHRLHKEVDSAKWCVTLEDLDRFENEVRQRWKNGKIPPSDPPTEGDDDENIGPSIYQVNQHYLIPTAREAGGMSWALMMHKEGLQCDVFASHCWAEGVFEFLNKVRAAWPVDSDAQNLYCCFLSNPQFGITEILHDIDPKESPFAKALGTAKYFIVIPNKKVSIYSRLWCVYEAHLAVVAARERGLRIELPSQVPRWKIFVWAIPGLLAFLCSAVASRYKLGPMFGKKLDPVLWLFFFFLLSHLLGEAALRFTEWTRCIQNRTVFLIRITWVQLLLVGVGIGLAHFELQTDWKAEGHLFEPGEGWACVPLAVSFLLFYTWAILRCLSRHVQKKEGQQLKFTSVRDAACSCEQDTERIRRAIAGNEDTIDNVIRSLSVGGRYDAILLNNIDKGVSASHASHGVNPLRIVSAVYMWEYWFITDLARNLHHYYCQVLPVVTCIILFVGLFLVRDSAVFAVDAANWVGLIFLLLSNLWLAGLKPKPDRMTSAETRPLQLACTAAVIISSVYHYSGCRKRLFGPGGVRWSCEVEWLKQKLGCTARGEQPGHPSEDGGYASSDSEQLALPLGVSCESGVGGAGAYRCCHH